MKLKDILFVIIIGLLLFTLGISLPILLFTALWPIVFVGLKTDSREYIFIAIAGSFILISLLLGLWFAVFYLVIEVPSAFIIIWGIKHNDNIEKIFIKAVLYWALLVLVISLGIYFNTGLDITSFFALKLNESIEKTLSSVFSIEEQKIVKETIVFFKSYFYSLVFIILVFGFFISYILARNVFDKFGIHLKKLFIDEFWRPKEYIIFILIIFLFLYLVSSKINFVPSFISTLSKNILLVIFSLYICNGVLLVSYFLKRFKVPLLLSFIFFFLLVLQPLMLILVGIFGIADVWVDFRKRIKPKENMKDRIKN